LKKGLAIVLVVGIAAAVGFVVQRLLPGDEAAVELAPAAMVAASETTPEQTQPPALKIPEDLPQFQLADRDGKPRSLGDWKGRPVMVNFWATWCGPCRREIPLLNQLRTDYKPMNLEIIGIAVDFRDDVLAYVKENPISYPLLIGEEDGLAAVQAMGMAEPGFPFTVFADSRQRILMLKTGELHRDDAELILDRLAKVDSGNLPLADARQQISEGLKELATRRAASKAGG
jgi:thiol-disulfide isomerase/thioredoxin